MLIYLETYIKHKLEMFFGHLRSHYLRLFKPKQYKDIKSLRGDYLKLQKIRKLLLLKLKKEIKSKNISCNYISRVKTISSIYRKCRYYKIMNKDISKALTDFIGIKIFPNNFEDCHKILKIIKQNYKLQKIKGMNNPENFFGSLQQMRDTDSKITNQIYVKILFNNTPTHIMIQPQSELRTIAKNRAEYIKSIRNKIKLETSNTPKPL